jgi:anaerobic selenocysteine-containing dehydrogenase
MEEFVQKSCEMTPGVKEAGGFEYMKSHGVWHDPKAKPKYYGYMKAVASDQLAKAEVIFDEATGTYWNWKKSSAKSVGEAKEKGYTHTKSAFKGYVGQRIGGKVYAAFKPDAVNKSGFFELYSALMEEKGFPPLPTWTAVPEHQEMGPNDLIMTTFKVAAQIHSRSQNCKWLTEIFHDNPGWINPESAAKLGIKNGDRITIKSSIGEGESTARVTPAVVPGVIACSHHCGHWEYGRYASDKAAPMGMGDDPELKRKWWTKNGEHPNWLIPNSPDPVNGQQRWMDTVVEVAKA